MNHAATAVVIPPPDDLELISPRSICGRQHTSPPAVARRVLIVDDDAGMRRALEISFLRRGWQVDAASGLHEAMARFRCHLPELVVTDVRMPAGDGFAVMRELRTVAPRTAVILLTAFANIGDAVTAMKDGACDYLVKPVDFEQLEQIAQRALHLDRPILNLVSNAIASKPPTIGGELIGRSPGWLSALAKARQVAASSADILIQAESGTGKELLARMIHRLSPRSRHPFIAVNCAAFPESLLESELFGHAKGAFTGAVTARPGKFEQAHGGTLLLDEIGEMPLSLQPKLLRALQEREFDRLGDSRPVKVDIRVIATTHRSLKNMVENGIFRSDLYYRLNVIPLRLPPLRERTEDIPELAEYFARIYAQEGITPRLSSELLQTLAEYPWPGNVRELSNVIHRVVALHPEAAEVGVDVLDMAEFASEIRPLGTLSSCSVLPVAGMLKAGSEYLRPGVSLENMERRLLEITLQAVGGNRSRAAGLLGVSLRTVRNKIRSYGLPPRKSYTEEKSCP